MKQLSEQEAIEMFESGIWRGWTDEQIVRFQLFQDRLCVDFSCFHKAISNVLNRPVYSHEFAFIDEIKKEYLGVKDAPTFDEIMNLIPEEKRIIVKI